MPRKANFIFEVRIRIPEAFTLDSIIRNPRTFKPKDVQSACQNNELAVTHGSPPPEVVSLATYVMTDFFAMAHATGLYNRQKALWESLAQVNSIYVDQLSSGVFRKVPLQIFDFSFLDYKGKPLLVAHLVCQVPEKKNGVTLVKDFVSRVSGRSGNGALVCFSARMPAEVLEYVQKSTHTLDPIAKYESVMPGLNKPFDLLEMNEANLTAGSEESDETELRTVFQLLHPDLKKKAPAGELPKKAKRPKKKKVDAVDMESSTSSSEADMESSTSSTEADMESSTSSTEAL